MLVTSSILVSMSMLLGPSTCAPLEHSKRQAAALFNTLSPIINRVAEPPFKVESIAASMAMDARARRIIYGPFSLEAGTAGAAMGEGHAHGSPRSQSTFGSWMYSILPEYAKKAISITDILTTRMDPNSQIVNRVVSGGICSDCTVLKTRLSISDARGTPIGIDDRGVYIHHAMLAPMVQENAKSKFTTVCPKNDKWLPDSLAQSVTEMSHLFAVQGAENFTTLFTSEDGKFDSGYYMQGGPMGLTSELVNYKSEPQDVYITLEYEYVPGRRRRAAFMSPLSVTGCLKSELGYFSNETINSAESGKLTVKTDGYILQARGHLHDGGVALKYSINNKQTCISEARYGGPGAEMQRADGSKWTTISNMSDCKDPRRVRKGDELQLTSDYSLEAHGLRISNGQKMEQMALMVYTFSPDPAPEHFD